LQEFCDTDRGGFVEWINDQWDVEYHRICRDVTIQGSPERTLSRAVFQDSSGHRYLIESFHQKKYAIRVRVAEAVHVLADQGLWQALAYKPAKTGTFLPFYKYRCYQLSDFLDSTGLKQPDYLYSSVMGESFAQFLIELSRASQALDGQPGFHPFSIKDYIYRLFDQMRIHDARVATDFMPVLTFLEHAFMDAHDQLPQAFCHGDLHPLNVIWNDDQIRAVIDWEFTGIKPDIYDIANLFGCAGIEDPNGIGMPMVMQCIKTLQAARCYSKEGWYWLPEYMLALRFAWLSEWLRKNDQQMIEMEHAYMTILMKNVDVIRMGWQI
jgi:homoserine kinase type II